MRVVASEGLDTVANIRCVRVVASEGLAAVAMCVWSLVGGWTQWQTSGVRVVASGGLDAVANIRCACGR